MFMCYTKTKDCSVFLFVVIFNKVFFKSVVGLRLYWAGVWLVWSDYDASKATTQGLHGIMIKILMEAEKAHAKLFIVI